MPTLLMFHGIGCDTSAWDAMKPAFEAGGGTCEAITLFPGRQVREYRPANLAELGIADFISASPVEAQRLAGPAAGKERATLPQAVRKVAAKYARSPVPGDFIEYPQHACWIVDEPGTDRIAAGIPGWLNRAA